ncbi:MAG TPA: BadF/BadG/BcrA/BcrD ATPase family protein [Geminicoccaceae bacterium]|nr:BadF/BadG/BcrA/BcrD ATPase family protein [Geminicoccaceae bacterium]
MREDAYVLAVDGGGTKTAAALLAASGEELAACRAGPATLYRDPSAGLASIADAWQRLRADADLPDRAAARTVISAGLAGSSGAAQRHAFAAAFPGFAGRRLSTDGYTAFVGVFGAEPGAMLAIGTGVVAYRRETPGAGLQVASGWGFPVADRGGGAWLGLRLTGEYLDHLDGCAAVGPESTLWAVAGSRVGREREAILAWLRDARPAEFAALAPAVVAAAAAGDPLGTTLLAEGASHLIRLARALRPTPEAPLCLGGGLAGVYRPRLETALSDAAVLPASRRPDPIRGAWLVATGQVPAEFQDVS